MINCAKYEDRENEAELYVRALEGMGDVRLRVTDEQLISVEIILTQDQVEALIKQLLDWVSAQ